MVENRAAITNILATSVALESLRVFRSSSADLEHEESRGTTIVPYGVTSTVFPALTETERHPPPLRHLERTATSTSVAVGFEAQAVRNR